MGTVVMVGTAHRDELHNKIKADEMRIRDLLPEDWEPLAKVNVLRLGFQLKIMGFDWRTQQQYAFFMGELDHLKIVEVQGKGVEAEWRRSPKPLYQQEA